MCGRHAAVTPCIPHRRTGDADRVHSWYCPCVRGAHCGDAECGDRGAAGCGDAPRPAPVRHTRGALPAPPPAAAVTAAAAPTIEPAFSTVAAIASKLSTRRGSAFGAPAISPTSASTPSVSSPSAATLAVTSTARRTATVVSTQAASVPPTRATPLSATLATSTATAPTATHTFPTTPSPAAVTATPSPAICAAAAVSTAAAASSAIGHRRIRAAPALGATTCAAAAAVRGDVSRGRPQCEHHTLRRPDRRRCQPRRARA